MKTIDNVCEHAKLYNEYTNTLYTCEKKEYCVKQTSYAGIKFCKDSTIVDLEDGDRNGKNNSRDT